ncbi:hypothetical protein PG997_011370 [Apiospora hydei]|uniref:ribonuclease H n=1 Tax=Apiospora hydei TaxID=1337664 RepID=A0ABR1VJV7_9PEZI
MPPGRYLAQGLTPLGPDCGDHHDGPCELPDGRLVCGPHGLVICGKCCTDYSFMDEELREDDDEDEDEAHSAASDEVISIRERYPSAGRLPFPFGGTEKRRGTGLVFPTKRAWMRAIRYTLPNDPGKLLLLTDGACLYNGQANPRAGWAFVHHAGTGPNDPPGIAEGRLESKGPFGDDAIQTSNRAELRAVIAALRFRHWAGENFHTAVIATDSEYVVEGSTVWAKTWVRNGWKTSGRAPVKNSDLWEMLLGEVERWKDAGMDIQFWRIPREWNGVADAAAKKAAEGRDVDEWAELIGMAI